MQGKYDDCCDAIAFNSVNAKRKADVFKFLPFEFRKALFSRRINEDGRPNRSNKAAFPNFSGVYSVDVHGLGRKVQIFMIWWLDSCGIQYL